MRQGSKYPQTHGIISKVHGLYGMPPKFDLAKTKPIVRECGLRWAERRDIATSGSEEVPHARVRAGMAIRQHHNPALRLSLEKLCLRKPEASGSAIMVGTIF